MASRRRRLIAAGPVVLAACAVAGPAAAATWRSPVYPSTTGSAAMTLSQPVGTGAWNSGYQPTAIALNGSGRATILYRAANRGIYRVSRTSATGAWSAGTAWLSSSSANVGTQLAATLAGSSVTAFWNKTTPTGRVATVAGSWTSASSSKVRNTQMPGGFAPQQLQLGTAGGSNVFFGASYSSVMQGGDAFGGISRAGAAPPLSSAGSALPGSDIGGSTSSALDSDASGNLVALVANSSLSASSVLSLATKAAGAASWTAAPVSPAAVSPGSFGASTTPFDVDVDSAGNAAIAYVTWVTSAGVITPSPVGNKLGVVVSQRVGAAGAFGAPQVVQVLPDGPPALIPGQLPLLQMPSMSVSVGYGSVALAFTTIAPGTGFTAWTTRGTLGQALPAPQTQVSPNAALEAQNGWGQVAMESAINRQGTVAVVFGGSSSNGATDGLWSTTSSAAGTWTPLKDIARCGNASGGYGGMDLVPYGSGFVASWACVAAGQFGARSRLLGTATYR